MNSFTEHELLSQKNAVTIGEAALLMTKERHNTALQAADSVLTDAINSGRLRTFSGWSGATQPYARHQFIRMSDLDRFFQSISKKLYQAQSPVKPVNEIPIPRTQAQETAVLNWLKGNGYDPQKLPKQVSGKSWVKKACKAVLTLNKQLFISEKTFDSAWERLRKQKAIQGGNQSNY